MAFWALVSLGWRCLRGGGRERLGVRFGDAAAEIEDVVVQTEDDPSGFGVRLVARWDPELAARLRPRVDSSPPFASAGKGVEPGFAVSLLHFVSARVRLVKTVFWAYARQSRA